MADLVLLRFESGNTRRDYDHSSSPSGRTSLQGAVRMLKTDVPANSSCVECVSDFDFPGRQRSVVTSGHSRSLADTLGSTSRFSTAVVAPCWLRRTPSRRSVSDDGLRHTEDGSCRFPLRTRYQDGPTAAKLLDLNGRIDHDLPGRPVIHESIDRHRSGDFESAQHRIRNDQAPEMTWHSARSFSKGAARERS